MTALLIDPSGDRMAPFADEHGAVVLAPLFPAGIVDPEDLHNFKFIEYEGIRYDHALLSMADEVAARYPIDADRFYRCATSSASSCAPAAGN